MLMIHKGESNKIIYHKNIYFITPILYVLYVKRVKISSTIEKHGIDYIGQISNEFDNIYRIYCDMFNMILNVIKCSSLLI